MARTPKIVEDRREQIIDAAMRVFSQKGFTKATNKDIARAAGITPGLIYHYFESKEAVLTAILENRSPLRLVGSLPAQVLELPPEAFFRILIPQVLDLIEGETFIQLIKVFLPEAIHNQSIAPFIAGTLQRVMAFLAGYLQTSMETGTLRSTDPSLAAQILIGSVIAFVLRRQLLHDPLALQYSHTEIANAVIETLLNGLRVQ